ncbi:YihY/virulence factor BrkB family protein [Thalassobacillus sp. B23F22_16]|uniref:YihY/virulence factor BrkB family protein n=1 Tax=Thalassobacillus sp. B23F22_16 TaxID=3459513 RepID=UPI00373E35D3
MKKMMNYMKSVIKEFQNDDVPVLAAAQAYYYLLSIVPMLILLFSIIPYLGIQPNEAVNFMKNVLPAETASALEENIISIVSEPNGGLLSVGIIGTIWSASNGLNAFIKSSNIAYNVEESRSFIKVRLLSIGLTLGMIVAIVVALVLPVFGRVIFDFIQRVLFIPDQLMIILEIARWVVSILVMSLILMLLYRFAPNRYIPFKEIIPGAIITSVLWMLISLGFSFYVSNFGSYSATYGSLGGLIILMIWFFLTGLILVVGAEINVVYHRKKHGLKRRQDSW